jgi:hypothetical protein
LDVADSREIRNKNGRTNELEASNGKKKKEAMLLDFSRLVRACAAMFG